MSRARIKAPKRTGYAKRHRQIRKDNRLLTRAMAYVLAEYGRPIVVPKEWMAGEEGHVRGGDYLIEDANGDVRFRSLHPRKLRHRVLLALRTLTIWLRAKLSIRRASKARRDKVEGPLDRSGDREVDRVHDSGVLLQAEDPPDARVSELRAELPRQGEGA